jgi:L-amino acid N-acyltransferase YncA
VIGRSLSARSFAGRIRNCCGRQTTDAPLTAYCLLLTADHDMQSTIHAMPRLRLAGPADAAEVATIYAPFCLGTAVSFETTPPDEDRMRERISTLTQRYPWLVAVSETGEVLGYAYAGKHRERAAYRWSVDFTAYLAPEAKRRGIGTALYHALMKICQSLGYYRAFAAITLPNEASVRLHEKIGFRAIGVYRRVGFKLGRWHDVGWWSLDLLPERELPPSEPRSIPDIVESGELEKILG